jgi:hypothetical protein
VTPLAASATPTSNAALPSTRPKMPLAGETGDTGATRSPTGPTRNRPLKLPPSEPSHRKRAASAKPSATSKNNETSSTPPAENATLGWPTTPKSPAGSERSTGNSIRSPSFRKSFENSAGPRPAFSGATSASNRQVATAASNSTSGLESRQQPSISRS